MIFTRGCGHKDSTYAWTASQWTCPWCVVDANEALRKAVAEYEANNQAVCSCRSLYDGDCQ